VSEQRQAALDGVFDLGQDIVLAGIRAPIFVGLVQRRGHVSARLGEKPSGVFRTDGLLEPHPVRLDVAPQRGQGS